MIDAAEAHRIGLVNQVHPADSLLAETEKLARAIIANAPLAVAACLEIATAQEGMQIDDALAFESAIFGGLFETEDAKEGAAAFLAKRAPEWKGR
jgi:enoyl-CoA hydratase